MINFENTKIIKLNKKQPRNIQKSYRQIVVFYQISCYYMIQITCMQYLKCLKEENMINERIIKKLKQTNISANEDKTRVRVRDLWKISSKAKKHAVEETAGISRATIYRVYNTGSISAKLVVPMAQNFNVDPNFLIGKIDRPGECTEEILVDFLKDLGYEKLLAAEAEKQLLAEQKQEAAPVEEAVYTESNESFSAADLNLADMHLLLQALLLREKAGVEDAVIKVAALRELLLS